VLSETQPASPGEIEAGVHGLVVARGRNRGLLLPQVAVEHSWSALRLLDETCRKAGLETDAWRHPETRLWAFTAEVFSEKEMRQTAVSGAQECSGRETSETSEPRG
jgi:uncharacterized protein (TIGR00296 family)